MFFRSLLPALLLGHNGRRKSFARVFLCTFFLRLAGNLLNANTRNGRIYITRGRMRSQKRVTQKRKELINESIYLLPTNGVIPGDHGMYGNQNSNVCVRYRMGKKDERDFEVLCWCVLRVSVFLLCWPEKVTVKSTFNTLRMILFVVTTDLPHACVCVCMYFRLSSCFPLVFFFLDV